MSFENKQPMKKIFPDLPFLQFVSHEAEEPYGMINLTGLFQRTLQKNLSYTNRNSVIARLDKLPLVAGSKSQLEQLSDILIRMIVTDLPKGADKLFLHIKCEKLNDNVIDLSVKNGFTPYSISFYTNVLPDTNRKFLFREQLNECAGIANKNNGTFSFRQAFDSCCLFSLTFP